MLALVGETADSVAAIDRWDDQVVCDDQKESYVSAWSVAPNCDVGGGDPDPDMGILIGNGELEIYVVERYLAEDCRLSVVAGGNAAVLRV